MSVYTLCPYCGNELSSTDDHIFPLFLGGRATIRAGKKCNDTFGHTIEGRASNSLAKWFLLLRIHGIRPPKPMVWRQIELQNDGKLYDIDSELKASLSHPEITRDQRGRVVGVHGAKRHVTKALESLQDGLRKVVFKKEPLEKFKVENFSLNFPVNDDIKRLCVKMAVACLEKSGAKYQLDPSVWDYLSSGTVHGICPVRITLEPYASVDELRPPVGHAIYIRSIASERRLFSLVQFFGALQFSCELATAADLADYAYLATHCSVTHEERYCDEPLLDYPVPPQFLSPDQQAAGFASQLNKLGRELALASGRPPLVQTAGGFGPLTDRAHMAIRRTNLESAEQSGIEPADNTNK